MDRENMEAEIKDNKFLEYGEHSGNLYGTHLDSIREVIKQGMIYIDVRMLKNAVNTIPCLSRQDVRPGLRTECTEDAAQQYRIHAIRDLCRCTRHGDIETDLRRAESDWWITEESSGKFNNIINCG